MTKSAAEGSPGSRAVVIIAWFGVFLFGGVLSAQPGIEAYDRGDLQTVREYLATAPSETAETLFLRAALMTDAEGAVEIYRKIVLTYPESPLSQRAMDRIRQYFYAQGKYDKAAEFEKALQNYRPPKPSLEETKTPILAAETEVKTADSSGPAVDTHVKSNIKGYYLQVGAFSSAANANKLKSDLQKAGFQVEILAPGSGSNRFHTVRVIGFTHEKEALAAAEDLRRKYKLSPILVPILISP